MTLMYIDPGTGSMLFTLLIGVLSTVLFLFKKIVIRAQFLLQGGNVKASETSKENMKFVIFSDHKRYWNVFKPICDEFERRRIPLWFFTASEDDPALSEDYEYITCAFLGEGNRAFAKLNMMNAGICLSTTPGLDVYQWKRSKGIRYYVHILHAVGSAAGYRMFGIDYYDALLLSGDFQVDEVRELEEKRNLPAKEIEVIGCTYLDEMAKRLQSAGTVQNDHKFILLAPSWGPSSILNRFGDAIIDSLIDTGYEIVIRPHPQSMTAEKDLLERLQKKYPNGDKLSWNFDNDNFDVLNRADVMITDFSGVVFDYTLVFDKPIIYTESKEIDNGPYDSAWLDHELWKYSVYPTLGIPLSEEQFPNMKDIIDRVVVDDQLQSGRDSAREEVWAHPGESVQRTVDYLVQKAEELEL